MRLEPPDQLSTTLIWISAVFMAAKAGIENWPAARLALPQVTDWGWLNFVPLALLAWAGILSIARVTRNHEVQKAVKSADVGTLPNFFHELRKGEERIAPKIDLSPEIRKDKIFLGANQGVWELMRLCDGKTDLHAKKAVEPYIGKWLHFRGIVRNVHTYGGEAIIRFDLGNLKVLKARVTNGLELADVIHVGDILEIVGRVIDIDSVTIVVEDTEIIDR